MSRVRVGQTLLIAGVCYLLPLGGNVVASFVTEWTGGRSWLVAPAVGLLVAMLVALVQAFGSAEAPAPIPPGPPGRAMPRPRRGVSLPVALAIAVAVIGLGGWAVTEGVRYAVGYVTGNESGTERLKQAKEGQVDGLSLTVESVEQTRHFTRVGLAARNESADVAQLPVFGNTFLTGSDGTSLQGDPFRSRWSEAVVPGGVQRGTVVFKGHLPNRVRHADFSFATIGGPFFLHAQGPLKVEDLRLRRG